MEIVLSPGIPTTIDGRATLQLGDRGTPVIPLRVGELELEGLIDDGADAYLSLPSALASRLSLESPPRVVGRMATLTHELDVSEARLVGTVRIGSIEVRDPSLRFTDLFAEPNIGRRFLQGCEVTFEQRNRRCSLRAAPAG